MEQKHQGAKRPCRIRRKQFLPNPLLGDRQKTCGAWNARSNGTSGNVVSGTEGTAPDLPAIMYFKNHHRDDSLYSKINIDNMQMLSNTPITGISLREKPVCVNTRAHSATLTGRQAWSGLKSLRRQTKCTSAAPATSSLPQAPQGKRRILYGSSGQGDGKWAVWGAVRI